MVGKDEGKRKPPIFSLNFAVVFCHSEQIGDD